MARVAVFIYLLLGFCLGTQASHSAWGAVALEGAWSSGTTHIAGGSSNTQRILVFVANTLNWQQSDITAVSYGGQALTQRVEVSVGTGTALRTEIWTLNEAGIQAASGSTFTVTYALSTPYGLNYYAATLSGVDQTNPITGTASTSNASSVTSLSTSVTGSAAGFIVAGVVGATSNTASFSEPGWSLGGSQSNSGSTGGVGYISITSGGSKSVTGVMGSSTSMALATLSLNETASLNPSSFTATASSNTSINLSWVRGGGSTTGYRIAYQSGASVPANCSTGTQVDLGAVASSQVTGLVASTQYSFRLCSYNASGTLSSGVTATATTQASAPAAPSEVLYPAAVADSSTQITLSWQNTSNNGNAGFRIAYQIGGTAPASCTTGTQINAGLTQNYSITGLTPLTQYSFRICAYNGTPTYTAGATANATTQATASTGVVNAEGSWIAGVSHSAEGAANTNRILIFATGHEHWDTTDLTAVSYGGRAMTQLLERQVGNSWDAARTELWYLKESDIQGANSGTFILTYSNGVPSTPLYSSAFFSNVDQTTPFPSSSSTDDASAALTTVSTNITRTKGGMSIACASSGNSGTFTANNSWVLGSTTTLGSMAFGVSRISSATSGTDSASFSLTGSNRMVVLAAHLGIAPPPNPISFTATSGSDTSIDLAWTKSGGTASGTRIAYQSGGTAPPSCTLGTQIDASTASSYTITGLTANTQYGFRICAYNTATAYSSGQTASITTLTTPPAAPNDLLWLSSSVTSDTAIVLSWTHGGGGTTGYRIAYQLGGTAPSTCLTGTQIAAGLTTSRTVTGLSPNTQYSFRVCGQNGVPVYSAGVTTSNTTNPTPPSNSITALGSWVTGLTHSSEGTEDTDRMLVVVSGYENYGTNDISTISYGGQVLTQRVQTTVGSSPGIGVEIWTLGEAGIQAASSSTIAVTYASGTPSSVTTASAFFKGFHPSTPIGTISSATNDTAASFLSTSVTGEADGLSIFGAQTGAATGMFSIGNSWTLGSSQNSGSTSMSVGHHPTSSSGPDMVDVSFAGSDRMALVAISLKAAPAAPPNVTSLSATANSDTQITLNWTSGGGSTTGYRIAYQSGGTAPASCSAGTQIDNGVSASYVLTGLTASTQYSFRVCAYNSLTRYSSGVTTSSTTAAATANWTGATSTNWFTASNWSPASVPNASRDCVLAPQVRSPTIAGTSGSLAQCRNLTLSTTLTVDGSSSATELRISGNLTSTGTITVNQGVVAITESGSASAQTVTLNGRLGNLLVRKALGGTISFPSGTTEIDSLSFASGAVATINLTSGRTLRLRNDLTLPANTTLKLLGGSQLEFESGRTFTVSGGTFQVSGDVDDLMTTGLQQGIVTTINNTGTWTFNSTSGTVNLLGFVLDRLAASGLNIAGSTTLSNLGGGHFENLSASASGKAIQLNTTGSVPSSSIYLGFNYVSAPSNGYLLASSTSTCSTGANHTIVFSEWYGNFYNPDSKTPNPNTKVVDTAPSCDIDISLANTPVSLAYLRAKSYDSAVLLEWETGSESAHQGFNVYRSENPSAGYSQLNSSLVRNILSSTSTRGVYRFLDSGTANGSIYYYLIEDVAVNGTTTRHGPVRAAPLAELGSAPALDGTVNEGLAGTGSTNSGGGALTNPGAEDLSGGVRVLAKYGSTLRVEIIPPQETYLVSSWNSAYSTVAMPGYSSIEAAGLPELPEKQLLIEVGDFSTATVDDSEIQQHGFAGAQVMPAPSWAPGPGNTLQPAYSVNPTAYASSQAWPSSFYQVAPTVLEAGGKHYLRITVHPLRVVTANQQILRADRILLDIGLDGSAWQSESPTVELAESPAAVRNSLRIRYREPGVHELRLSHLRSSYTEAPYAGKQLDDLRLYYKGKEIPLEILDRNEDGLWDTNDALRFVTAYERHREDSENEVVLSHYALGNSTGAPLRMPQINAAPGTRPEAPARFTRTRVSAEQNLIQLKDNLLGEGADPFYWTRLYNQGGTSEVPAYAKLEFSLNLPGLSAIASQQVVLNISMAGRTATQIPLLHHILVYVNGKPSASDELVFSETGATVKTALIPADHFAPGINTLTLTLPADLVRTGELEIVDIDRVEVDYPRRYIADSESTFGLLDPFLDYISTVTGFHSSQLSIYYAASPWESARLTGAETTWDATGTGSAQIRFVPRLGSGSGSIYELRPDSEFPGPSSLSLGAGYEGSLRSGDRGADLILIAHPSFLKAYRLVAQARKAQGLRVTEVTLDQIYSEFGQGLRTTDAIRAFLLHASSHWQAPAPRYALLIGRATDDPRGLLSAVPPFSSPVHIKAGQYMDFGSDPWLETDDSGSPRLAIGRIPAASPGEAIEYAAKLLAYESDQRSPVVKGARGRMAFVAGPITLNEGFSEEVGKLASAPALTSQRFDVRRIDRAQLSSDAALRSEILSEFNRSPFAMTWVGHGGEWEWHHSTLFGMEDARTLTNRALPIVLSMDCLSGYHYSPDISSRGIGEALVVNPDGGAIAVWSSTTMSASPIQMNLAQSFFDELGRVTSIPGGKARLGDVVLKAKLSLNGSVSYSDVMYSWTLLGDPSMLLPSSLFSAAASAVTNTTSNSSLPPSKTPSNPDQDKPTDKKGGFLGCGTMNSTGKNGGDGDGPGAAALVETLALFLIAYGATYRKKRRGPAW